MRILVTGSESQLAVQLIRIAEKKNYKYLALTRDELDITDEGKVAEKVLCFRPDYAINCAAYNDVDGAEKNSSEAFAVNAEGVKNLAVLCKKTGTVMVHFSTDYVFSGKKTEPYSVSDTPDPINTYGKSKLLGEQCLTGITDKYFLIRTSWVYGNGKNSFPEKVLKMSEENQRLRIADDQVSSPTYTTDLAIATFKLINTGNYGTYHITNSGSCSRYEWVKLLLEKSNWKGTVERAKMSEFNSLAERPVFSVLDNFPLSDTREFVMPSWQNATERFLSEKP